MLKPRFVCGTALMLWSNGSSFLISSFWPTCMPKTRGWYSHPFWSITAGVLGGAYVAPAGRPLFTYTKALPRPPLLTMYCESTGVEVYFALQAGSSVMSTVGFAGAVPAKWTVPLTTPSPVGPVDAAADAAPPAVDACATAPVSDFFLLLHETISAKVRKRGA